MTAQINPGVRSAGAERDLEQRPLVGPRARTLTLGTFRNVVQILFVLLLLKIGWQFYRFVSYYESFGAAPYATRPPGVEGFLPLSALVAFKAWLATGVFDSIHPAGLVLFLAIAGTSLLFKKGFCSWLCPVGTLSEYLGRLGVRFFGRNFKIPALLDRILQGLKYLLLAFFLNAIVIGMPGFVALAFLESPYNKVADVKMLKFFTEISTTAASILLILALASILVRNFWCRYLCPYGALLGLLSYASPVKVQRNAEACTGCLKCNRVCPNRLDVAASGRVISPECTACLECVEACPFPGALDVTAGFSPGQAAARPLNRWAYPALLLGVFLLAILLAQLTSHWQTALAEVDWKKLIPMAGAFSH